MRFTGLLKEKIEAAETKEEVKKVLEEAGIELTDEELEAVDGGLFAPVTCKLIEKK